MGATERYSISLATDAVVHDLLPRHYLPGLPGLLEEQALLARLLMERQPMLHSRLDRLGGTRHHSSTGVRGRLY